jgi:hypothetical protein
MRSVDFSGSKGEHGVLGIEPNAAEMPKLVDTFCRPAPNWQEEACKPTSGREKPQ